MSTWAIIQARLGSTRLPGKVLMHVGGRPVIDRVVDRAAQASRLDGVLVAVPEGEADAPLREHLARRGVRFFAGSEHDVLDRYRCAATEAGAVHVVRLTADNPLVDPALIDAMLDLYAGEGVDYASIATGWAPAPEGVGRYPHGLDAEVCSFGALTAAWREATDPKDREHVTRFLWRRPERFSQAILSAPEENGDVRLTIDTAEDLAAVDRLVRRLGERQLDVAAMVSAAKADPALLARPAAR